MRQVFVADWFALVGQEQGQYLELFGGEGEEHARATDLVSGLVQFEVSAGQDRARTYKST